MPVKVPGDRLELPWWAVESWLKDYQVESNQAEIDWEDMSQGKIFLCWGPADGDDRAVVLREEDNILTVYKTVTEAVLSTRVVTLRTLKDQVTLSEVADDFAERTERDRTVLLDSLLARVQHPHPALDWLSECHVLGIMSAEEIAVLSNRVRNQALFEYENEEAEELVEAGELINV